jgi:hypothetical protein
MAPRRRQRPPASAPAKVEAVSTETSHDDFDARAYFLALAPSYTDWPKGAVRKFEEEGFLSVRLQQIKPHAVWELWMKCPDNNLTSNHAGWIVRRVVEQAGRIPRGGFSCSVDRRGIIKAGFVLDV